MPNYQMLVFSNAVAGREKEYNDWYNDIHLRDVIACPGVAGGQRFAIKAADGKPAAHGFLAIYDLEKGADPFETLGEISKRAGTGAMKLCDALHPDFAIHFLEPVTDYRKE